MYANIARINRTYHERLANGITFRTPIRYQVQEFLGNGTYGAVVRAHDTYTHAEVAIKKAIETFDHRDKAKRTYRELVLAQVTNHPNVIKILDIFTPQNNMETFRDVYFVMEYAEKGLREVIDNREFFGENGGQKLITFVQTFLSGLKHLHQAGVVHRDLCPDNIRLTSNYEAKIIDLGLARVIYEDLENTNITHYVTKRPYRAPEIILGLLSLKKYGKKVDIWSFGCILSEILLGCVLFYTHPGLSLQQHSFIYLGILWDAITLTLGTPDQSYNDILSEEELGFVRGQRIVYSAMPFDVLLPYERFPSFEGTGRTASMLRDLISRMLVIDPRNRITADEALSHEFVQYGQGPNMPPLDTYKGDLGNVQPEAKEWKLSLFTTVKQYEREHLNLEKAKSDEAVKIQEILRHWRPHDQASMQMKAQLEAEIRPVQNYDCTQL